MAAQNSALTFLYPILSRRKTPSPNMCRLYLNCVFLKLTPVEVSEEEYPIKNVVYFKLCTVTTSIWWKIYDTHRSGFFCTFHFFFFKAGNFNVKRAEQALLGLCSPMSFCREVFRDRFLSSETAVFFTAGWLTCSIARMLGRPFAFWTTVRATANGICGKAALCHYHECTASEKATHSQFSAPVQAYWQYF